MNLDLCYGGWQRTPVWNASALSPAQQVLGPRDCWSQETVSCHTWMENQLLLGCGEKTLHLCPQGASHLIGIRSASANSVFLLWSCGNAWVKDSVVAGEAVCIVITNQSWKICLGLKPSGHFPTVQPWVNYLISLCCNFPPKMRAMIIIWPPHRAIAMPQVWSYMESVYNFDSHNRCFINDIVYSQWLRAFHVTGVWYPWSLRHEIRGIWMHRTNVAHLPGVSTFLKSLKD